MGYKELIIEMLEECDEEKILRQIYTLLYIWKETHP